MNKGIDRKEITVKNNKSRKYEYNPDSNKYDKVLTVYGIGKKLIYNCIIVLTIQSLCVIITVEIRYSLLKEAILGFDGEV